MSEATSKHYRPETHLVHGGTLRLLPTERGATFEMRLPAAPRPEEPDEARGLGTPRERTWMLNRGPAAAPGAE